MNLIVKLSVVPIFFLPLIAGWAGQSANDFLYQMTLRGTQVTVRIIF